MDFGSVLKNAVSGIASNLGLDNAVVDKLEDLVGKLDQLDDNGKLDKVASDAKETFKKVLDNFKSDKIDLSALAEKAKTFIGNLSGAELPSDIKGIVEKISGLLGK